MEFITWKDEEYSVGHPLIDAHHRIFFEMVHDLSAASKEATTTIGVGDVLGFLTDYITMHFQAEEQLMAEHHYPELDSHSLQHGEMTNQIGMIERRFHDDESSLTLDELLSVMQHWFLHHILNEDKKYVPWLGSKSRQ